MSHITKIVEAMRAIARHTNKPIDAKKILRLSAEVMNNADRDLFEIEDMGAAITSIVMREIGVEGKAGFYACREYGRMFSEIPLRQDEFAPSSEQWNLLKGTIAHMFNQIEWTMTPSEIEKKFNLHEGTVRQYVSRHPEIEASNEMRRPDGRTILINRATAERIWGSDEE